MSWGARADQEFPGLSQLMIDVVFEAFNEDHVIHEAQQLRVQIKSLFLGPWKFGSFEIWEIQRHRNWNECSRYWSS